MAEPIKASYWETVDHMVKASAEIPSKRSSLFLVAVIVTGPLAAAMRFRSDEDPNRIWWLVVTCFIYYGLMWLFFYCRPVQRWQLRRYWSRHLHEKPLVVEWTFSEADVIQQAGSETVSRTAWEHFKRAVRKPNGFLLETPNKTWYWLPRESFSSNDSFEAVAELFKRNVRRYETSEKA